MPTVARVGPYRFFFYANDRDEPPRFAARELGEIERIVTERDEEFLGAWNAFFDVSE